MTWVQLSYTFDRMHWSFSAYNDIKVNMKHNMTQLTFIYKPPCVVIVTKTKIYIFLNLFAFIEAKLVCGIFIMYTVCKYTHIQYIFVNIYVYTFRYSYEYIYSYIFNLCVSYYVTKGMQAIA